MGTFTLHFGFCVRIFLTGEMYRKSRTVPETLSKPAPIL